MPMTYWSALDINEFWTKDNNGIVQCVTCNKSPLFAPRQKALEKKGKKTLMEQEKFPNVLVALSTNSFLYEIEVW